MTDTIAIQTIDLKKSYRVGLFRKQERWGLKGLSLEVRQGEVFGCLGPNGAGKTTTLKLLMGLIYPTAGSALILEKPVGDPHVKKSIGFLPEHPYFYDYLTARELLHYYAQLSEVDATKRSARVDEMLARVGLTDVADTQLRKFSKGMLQRVGLAQAIIHDPQIVFLDEPMSGLDPVGRREVRDLMADLRDQGKTIFFSTHILSDAETLCDRVAVLHKGELRGTAIVADLIARGKGRIEMIYTGARSGSIANDAMQKLGAECRVIGESTRAVLDEAKMQPAIDALRQNNATLLSINPVHGSLEEYFLKNIDAPVGELS